LDDLPGCQIASELDILAPETQEKLRQWMMGLPKLLWQLGTKNPTNSHVSHQAQISLLTFLILTKESINCLIDSLFFPFYIESSVDR
jgi:hypothetical protein